MSLEDAVGKPAGYDGARYARNRIYRSYGSCAFERKALGLLQEKHTPAAYSIARYVYEGTRKGYDPYTRIAEHPLLKGYGRKPVFRLDFL